MIREFFNACLLFLSLSLCFVFGTLGCGALGSLSDDPSDTVAALSVDEESLVSLEALLETPAETTLTSEQVGVISALSEQGVQAQRDGDMSGAVKAMGQILAIDPNHATANFIVGVHDVNTLLMDEEVRSEFNRILTALGDQFQFGVAVEGSSLSSNSDNVASGIVDNILFVTSTDNQVLQEALLTLENHIPRLNAAIVRLQRMLVTPGFNYRVVSEKFDIDHTVTREHLLEVYAGLNIIRGFLDMGLAYDLSFAAGNYASGSEFFSKNPQFLTLRSGGVAHMTRARVSFENAITAALASERSEVESYRKELLLIRRSLKGETVYFPFSVQNESKTQVFDHTLGVNLGNFFNSPIPDFRRYLGVNMQGVLNADSFPAGFDFTLGGLFPELDSYEDWQQYNSFGLTLYNDETAVQGEIYAYSATLIKQDDLMLVLAGGYSDGLVDAEVYRLDGDRVVTRLGGISYQRSWHGYSDSAAFGDDFLYYSGGDNGKLSVYDVSGESLVLLGSFDLNARALDMYVYNGVLYVVTETGIDRYSLADPEAPDFVDRIAFVASIRDYNHKSTFYNNEVSILTYQWNWPSGYTITRQTYDLVSGESTTAVLAENTGYTHHGGYLDGQFVSVINTSGHDYEVTWEAGPTVVREIGAWANLQMGEGLLSVFGSDLNFGPEIYIYDMRTPGTVVLKKTYRVFSGYSPSAALPTARGVWVYSASSKLQFLPY